MHLSLMVVGSLVFNRILGIYNTCKKNIETKRSCKFCINDLTNFTDKSYIPIIVVLLAIGLFVVAIVEIGSSVNKN